MITAFTAGAAITPQGAIADAVLLVQDGTVAAFGPASAIATPAKATVVPLGSATLSPAFVDVHCHGSAGHDVMQASAEGEREMAAFLAAHGVGRFLPTTVTADVETTLRALERMANWITRRTEQTLPGARPVGIHLEGPFISHAKRGVQPAEHIQPPSVELFDRFWQASQGHIRLMTLAPELPGALDLLRHAADLGVRVSLGHSNATAKETQQGIAAGAASATHCFNAMRGFDHREPGVVGAVLDCGELYAELICDGHHVSDEAIRLFARAKPADRRILVTDAISATGQGDGQFLLGQLQVQVAAGKAMLDGKLAGSVLTMDLGVQNFARVTALPLAQAAQAASQNPAAMLGLPAGLAVGSAADFVVLGHGGRLMATYLAGEAVV
jgi:N-acetylglucosamine-6-phosphate deacetylase